MDIAGWFDGNEPAADSTTEALGPGSHRDDADGGRAMPDPVHVLRDLAGVDNPVIGGRSHEQHHGDGDQEKAYGMHESWMPSGAARKIA